MLSCYDVALYFLKKTDPETNDISNLKLQKLLYYAQGYSLAMHNTPLFKQDIFAWQHGPVVTEVYEKYKQFDANPISTSEPLEKELDTEIKDILDTAYFDFGQYSAWKLRALTHSELPWLKASQSKSKISLTDMSRHFKEMLSILDEVDIDELREDSMSFDEAMGSIK